MSLLKVILLRFKPCQIDSTGFSSRFLMAAPP